MLSVGRSNYMRFNHPAEANHLKSVLPNPRISMAPISFSLLSSDNIDLERKPPVAPRKSPRSSCSDDEVGFFGKLSKFEMLARQNRNCVSPKVFPAGSLTTNVPADQILGHSRSSSLLTINKYHNSPLQNVTNIDRNRSPITPNSQYHTTIPNQIYNNNNSNNNSNTTDLFQKFNKTNYSENNNENNGSQNSLNNKLQNSNYDLMSKSFYCQRTTDTSYDKFGREFDMSQSLIVTKTTTTMTTTNEDLNVDKFGSNPSLYSRQSNGSFNGSLSSHSISSNTNVTRLQQPSPAFNRNPKYNNEQKKLYGRVKSPTPSNGSGCSLDELRERQIEAELKRKEAENMRIQAQKDRFREQEIEKQEKMRLEEILVMCAEYERQSNQEKPRQPNRIKTNGSLPRDKRPGYNSPFNSPKNSPQFSFESPNATRKIINQNENSPNSLQSNSSSMERLSPSTNTSSSKWQNDSNSTVQSQSFNYENVKITIDDDNNSHNTIRNETTRQSPITIGNTKSNNEIINSNSSYESMSINGNTSIYENVNISSMQNNNKNYSTTLKQHDSINNNNKTCEKIDNKITISNDDLLEAIEQLSMLSKPKEICVTPKKNELMNNNKLKIINADKKRKELQDEDRKKYIEFLKNEKLHILGNMDVLKRSVADIEIQEEEINRALELEKALLSAEHESESLKLLSEESEKASVQERINVLECGMAEDTESQANLQTEAKLRVEKVEKLCKKIEEEYNNCNDELLQQEISEKLTFQQEALENERKTFEDMEFHHLEEEASKLATREELQRYLSELSKKIDTRKCQLNQLESQRNEAKSTATKESRSLERLKLGHMRRLEEGRNRIREIDEELESLTKNTTDKADEKRSPSREDFDRISRVTNDSPIVNNQGSLGRKTIESLKEIERNRQLHLAKQGSQVISDERRRVEELKRRVQDEVRTQWEERKMNCASFNSVESGEESSSYSTGPTESGSGSSDGADVGANEKMSPSKLSEFTSPSPGPSTNSYTLLNQNDNMRDGRRTSMEGERLSTNSVGIVSNGSRPISQTSSGMESVGSFQTVKHRDKPKLQRPLTRYLPIKSESLDLKNHIETAGHHLPLIHDVTVDTTTCCGTLSKMSKKFHHWSKRWFVFDRKRKSLSYYSDSSLKKLRGVIYFQSIEAVYVDPINPVRSPQPALTFIVKTTTRVYHLMAPSPEAMRVWVDVVITGAEGQEFDYGV
ncbi:probable serine/threonine-protein kinase tsuA isoform X2 [Aphidius gifuensis]|nr:probable serine/threonine-protein kinase tsuA isoform X2 [Aphidius gifuensis]XP_044016961.1 probable serine/threonine-protein kinase tsuA isoform X2 [Aphidius gifuensis]